MSSKRRRGRNRGNRARYVDQCMVFIDNFLKTSMKSHLGQYVTIQEFYTVKLAEPLKSLSFFLKDDP